MDARRILLVSIIVCFTLVESTFAAPNQSPEPGTRTAYFAGQSGWAGVSSSNAAPPSTPAYDRYGYPVTASQPAVGPPPSISDRAQNAVSETATSLRDGGQALGQQFQNWTGAAARQVQSAPTQPKYSSPFAPPTTTQSANPSPSSPARGNAAPPPWPTASTPTSTGTAPRWPDSTGAAAAATDRSVLVDSSAPSANTGWPSAVSNTGAPPPLLVPQFPTTNTNAVPIENSATHNGRSYSSDSSRQTTIHSPLTAPPGQSATPSAAPANNWLNGWDTNSPAPQVTIGRTGNSPSATNTGRNADGLAAQPAAISSPESKRTRDRKSSDFRIDDPWPQTPQPSINGQTEFGSGTATIASKPTLTTGSNSTQQPSLPTINPPANGPAATNVNPAGFTPNGAQSAGGVNGVARAGPTSATNNPPQPWVPLIAAVLSLAGSLAANLFLGWSYLDARQKYESLVRRTAETFRRTKPAAAA